MNKQKEHTEQRDIVIYGYSRQDLEKIMRHFSESLPDYIRLTYPSHGLCTNIRLTGKYHGLELLRFNMNKYHRTLADLFREEVISLQDETISQILGKKLLERELTVSSAESCTGGNIAHRIVETSGSSAYFLGSVVGYSNEVKADVLGVDRSHIDRFGAVSREVVEEMVTGVCKLMHTDCGIATSGVAGPHGGTPAKPVGTVWFAVKYNNQIVSECRHFKGNRNAVIEAATNHGMVMLLNLLRESYHASEYAGDE